MTWNLSNQLSYGRIANSEHPDWNSRIIDFAPDLAQKVYPYTNNGMAINRNSRNKERAMMVLNEFYTNPEIYDLTKLGIEGVHWEAVGEDQYKLLQGQDEDAYGQWRDRMEDWQDASRQARDRYESLEKQDYSNYLALMKYYASRAKQEQDAALAQQKLEASAARSGSARSSSGGSRKASLSSTASESLERTMNTYLSQGDTGRVKQLFLQYRDRMTPLQKRRFEKLMGKYNIPMTE